MSASDPVNESLAPWYAVSDGSYIGSPLWYYYCGNEVGVCFATFATGLPVQPSTARVLTDGKVQVDLHLTWYESDLFNVPCNQSDWFATQLVQFTVAPGQQSCRTVSHANNDDDAAWLEICVSNLDPSTAYLLGSPPPSVDTLLCEGAARSYTCDTTVSAPGGLSKVSWSINDQEVVALQNQTAIARSCAANATVRVRVTATDRQQRSATRSTSVRCQANPN
jgi:hypothetical protein